MKIENDDPILTAYALGELSDADRRAVEAELAMNPAAREAVSEIRATANLLSQQLQLQQLKEMEAFKQTVAKRPLKLPAGKVKFADRVQGWPARVFTIAVAASIVLVVGGIPLAILLGNQRARQASVVLMRRADTQPAKALSDESITLHANVNEGHYPLPLNATAPKTPVPDGNNVVYADGHTTVERNPYRPGSTALTQNPSQPPVEQSHVNAMAPRPLVSNQSPQMRAERTAPPPAPAASISNNPVVAIVPPVRGFHGQVQNPAASKFIRQSTGAPVDARTYASLNPASREEQLRERVEAPTSTETYSQFADNKFLDVASNPLSTFSIDVDTASYSTIRRFITQNNTLPPKEAVRIEEMLNYFPYEYEGPANDAKDPFASHVEISECPWQPEHRLVRVALKAKNVDISKRPPSNLTFLIDVSGSMADANKLPLLKECMKLLVQQLDERDRVAIVVYAGNSGLLLPSTSCANKQPIVDALESLQAGGSTNGEGGIQLAYQTAVSSFIEKGSNRVILCTDGDFNVGMSDPDSLQALIEQKAKSGVFLSVLGFGMGNTKDATMERLADKGNGNYAYIDSLEEGRKVLVEQMSGTLLTVAKDVKIQIEFNPAKASAYRLIGYENRMLAKEDFNDDRKDAGDMGAGHAVTALYEVIPAGQASGAGVDPLKYQKPAVAPATVATTGVASDELLTLKMRYKQPDGETSKLMEVPVTDAGKGLIASTNDFRFAAAVAELGMILRGSPYKGAATYASVMELADASRGTDPGGYRKEFVELVRKARTLANQK
jgi:Ca-activated chloride channel family protein